MSWLRRYTPILPPGSKGRYALRAAGISEELGIHVVTLYNSSKACLLGYSPGRGYPKIINFQNPSELVNTVLFIQASFMPTRATPEPGCGFPVFVQPASPA